MRVPDRIYLIFKLKSRISDSGWQDLTNLTKLGRTGVSKLMFFSRCFIKLDKCLKPAFFQRGLPNLEIHPIEHRASDAHN